MEGMDPRAFVAGMSALAVGICGLAGAFGAFGQGIAAGKAAEAVARQPENRGAILSTMLIGQAVAETNGIYGLILAFMLMFVNPFINMV
jgi:F-type H+-transporting ATPase subunit c